MISRLNKQLDYVGLLLGLSFLVYPFSTAISNLLLLPAGLLCFPKWKESTKALLKSNEFKFIIYFVLFICVKAAIFGNIIQDFTYYKKYLYFLFVPIIVFNVKDVRLFFNIFILSTLIMIACSSIKLYDFYQAYHYLPFNTGWTTNYVLVVERPYFGFCLLVCCLILLSRLNDKFKTSNLLMLLFFLFIILFISIRASLISFILCFLIYLFGFSQYRFKIKIFVSVLLVSGFATYMLLNKNLSERMYVSNSLKTSISKLKESEPRIEIYRCVKDMINENQFSTIFGFQSYTEIYNRLTSCYNEKIEDFERRKYFLTTEFNSHNQFLDAYLIGGIVGFSLLISFFFFSLVSNIKKPFYLCVLLSTVILLLVENMFFRQFGCMLFIVFTTLPCRYDKEN